MFNPPDRLSQAPYFDDAKHALNENYKQILFKPGYAVQARELTQMQTNLQAQLASIASHSMKDGTPIAGAKITFSTDQSVLKATMDDDLVLWKHMRGITFYGQNTDYIIVDDAQQPGIDGIGYIAFSYLGKPISETEETFKAVGADFEFRKTSDPVSKCLLATVSEGEIFIDGYVVNVDKQTVMVSPTIVEDEIYYIGFLITREIITTSEDASLNDNAQGSTNFNAPGADRYKITAELFGYSSSNMPSDDVMKNFVAGIAVQNGEVIMSQESSISGELLDILAKRTYEESGSYSVNPWRVVLQEDDTDESKFIAAVQPGTGYIEGYRVENLKSVLLTVPKPRDYLSKGTANTYFDGGAYTIARTNGFDAMDAKKMFNFECLQEVYVCNGENGTGVALGKCRVYNINYIGSEYRIYLTDLASIRSGFTSAKSLCSTDIEVDDNGNITGTPSAYVNLRLNSMNFAELYGQDVPQIVKIPYSNVRGLADNSLSYNTVRVWTQTSTTSSGDSTPKVIIEASETSNIVFEGAGSIIGLIDADGMSLDVTKAVVQVDNNSKRLTLSLVDVSNSSMSIQPNTNYTVIVRVKISDSLSAAKISKMVTMEAEVDLSEIGDKLMLMDGSAPAEDVYELMSLEVEGEDFTSRVQLEPNQTDYLYKQSFLSGMSNVEVPAGKVKKAKVVCTFLMYNHQGEGPFTASSYGSNYNKVQIYNSDAGVSYNLRDCIDFRVKESKIASNALSIRNTVSGEGQRFPLSNFNVECVPSVYLPRYDTVWVDRNGVIDITLGISSENPVSPMPPNNAMVIAYLCHDPYMVTLKTSSVQHVRSQRYTMQDIGVLEDRIARTEEMLSLTLLEQSAVNMQIVDENGYDRYKSGIFTDSFATLDNSNWGHPLFNCTVDSEEKCLRPQFIAENVSFELVDDPADVNKAVQNTGGAFINLPKSDSVIVSENLFLSDTINLQEYMFFKYDGELTLTPSVDTWVNNLGNIPLKTVYVETPKPATVWKDWRATLYNKGQTIYQYGNFDWRVAHDRVGQMTSKEYSAVSTGYTYSDSIIQSHKENDAFMRERWVRFELNNMRQGTRLVADIDNNALTLCYVNGDGSPRVNAYGQPIDLAGAVIAGADSDNQNNVTDNKGTIKGCFKIPPKVPCGEKIVTFRDVAKTTEASAPYQANGITIWNDVTRTYVRQWKMVETGRTSTRNWDPVAQSFRVEDEYGFCLDAIDLFFATKDTADQSAQPQPVTVYLVECENGYPTMNEVPMAECTLSADKVNLLTEKDIEILSREPDPKTALLSPKSDGSTWYTRFKFPDPVYLQNGKEYAFIVMANSYLYSIWISKLGNTDRLSKIGIYEQPVLGSMFMSQNRSTWNADQSADISFRMWKAQFPTDADYTATFKIGNLFDYATTVDGIMDVCYQCLCAQDFIQSPCSIRYSYRWADEPNFTIFNNMDDKNLDVMKQLGTQEATGSPELYIKATMRTSDKNISPFIDSEAIYGIFCQNILEERETDNDIQEFNAGTYISRTVEMENAANSIKMLMDIALPANSKIKAYVKTSAYKKKYVEPVIDNSGLLTDSSQISKMVGKNVQIYYQDKTTGKLTAKTRAVISGWNGGSELFMATVGNPDELKNLVYTTDGSYYEFGPTNSLTTSVEGIFLLDYLLNEGDTLDIPEWTPTAYQEGSIVKYGNAIWKAAIDTTMANEPSNLQAFWQKIPGIKLASTLLTDETEVEWREMEPTADLVSNASYVEYSFNPKYEIESEFTKFSIRIDLISRDKVHVPTVKNLRAIAVL